MESPASQPAVSVVTTVLRADPTHFAATVRSVQAQTFRDFEWIVLEKPPHGCVAELLAGVQGVPVRHLRVDRAMSLAEGRNLAMREARADLLAILDADDECAPGRLAAQVARLRAEPDLAVLGGAIEVIDGDGRPLGFRAYPSTHDGIVAAMRRFNPLAQPAVMLRRSAFERSGGYRSFDGAVEDYDLWSRLARDGCRFANLAEVVLRYRVHGGSTKLTRLRANLRDTIRVKREHWEALFTFGDRLRICGERALLLLPPSLVQRLFLATTLRRRLPPVPAA